jgi:hypothetical protein
MSSAALGRPWVFTHSTQALSPVSRAWSIRLRPAPSRARGSAPASAATDPTQKCMNGLAAVPMSRGAMCGWMWLDVMTYCTTCTSEHCSPGSESEFTCSGTQ